MRNDEQRALSLVLRAFLRGAIDFEEFLHLYNFTFLACKSIFGRTEFATLNGVFTRLEVTPFRDGQPRPESTDEVEVREAARVALEVLESH